MIKYLIIHAVSTVTIFMLWVINNGEPGGVDGMTPLLTFYTVSVQLLLGIIISFLIKQYINTKLKKVFAIISYGILYEVIFFIISSQLAIIRAFESGFDGEVFRAYSLSSISGVILSLIALWTSRTSKG